MCRCLASAGVPFHVNNEQSRPNSHFRPCRRGVAVSRKLLRNDYNFHPGIENEGNLGYAWVTRGKEECEYGKEEEKKRRAQEKNHNAG